MVQNKVYSQRTTKQCIAQQKRNDVSTRIARVVWRVLRAGGVFLQAVTIVGWLGAVLLAFWNQPLWMIGATLVTLLVFGVLLVGMSFCNWIQGLAGEGDR